METPETKELKMKPDDLIVTKTDKKGRIIYCNDTFMEFSGYYEEELLGQPHNVIRHGSMPRAVFRLMWERLKEENEFVGVVKNRRKNDGFYWTFANIMPNFNAENEMVGYMSVRRCPPPEAIAFFDSLYVRMNDVESQFSDSREAMNASTDILMEAVAEKGGYDEFVCSYYK
jgi:PAS domain S-box-containing protein